MRCPRCQAENPSRAKFCLECGAKLALACAKCRAELPGSAKFCLECGDPVASRPDTPVAAPATYTPKHLAERILTSKASLEGERKQVTVLFADLKGSMELLADRDPEEARKLLDPVIEYMMEAVHRYEGTVNQVMGDGIMALFGAPLAHEDHAVRACYAALRMQETVKHYADRVFRTHGVPVRIRVGLNSGEVVVRAIGSDLHIDYTAVGQTTHLAARMEQIADPGTTRLTADTLHLAEGFVQVQALGPTPVKGLNAPVEVFELTGASPVRSRLQATSARGLTKFVGRDGEMATLFGALEQARAGHGQVVAIVGEPGVGKSRLVWEFTHSHRAERCLVLEAPSVSYGKATTYLPVIDLLKRYAGIEPRDDGRKIREKVTGKLFSLDRALEPCLAPLLWLLDAPVDDAAWERLDPVLRRQRLHEAIRRLLLREAREQPLVLVFEDLHWIDGETQAVLDGLVESLPAVRVCLVLNYRPEYRHGWGGKTYYTQLRLDALGAASAAELLAAVLGADASVQPLVPVLIARTEGNPFFLEETVQTLAEAGALAGQRGAYRLLRTPEALDIPATAQAILSARIDRLATEDKRLLQTASVIGKDVPYPLLAAIAELDEAALRAGLGRLQEAEFLYEVQLFPELEHTFKHALTQEVAYTGLLQEQRRGLHARIVSALESLSGERVNEHAERIADHALKSEDWLRAARYLRIVGGKALSQAAYQHAANHFGRALAALDKTPDDTVPLEASIDVRFGLHDALLPLCAYDRIREVLGEAEELARALGDRRRLGRAYAYLSHHAWIALGDNERAAKFALHALETAGQDNRALEIAVAFYLGQINLSRGDLHAAIDAFSRCMILAAVQPPRFLEVFFAINARSWAVYPHTDLGLFDEALGIAEDGLRIAEESGNSVLVASACTALGHIHMSRGSQARALEYLERGLSIPGVRDLPQRFGPLGICMAETLALAGRAEEAVEMAEEVLQVAGMIGGCRSWWLGVLARAYLSAERRSDALLAARQARELAAARSERLFEARALYYLGLASAAGTAEWRDAANYLHEAMVRGHAAGMRPLIAHCHAGLANLYWRTGQRDQAQQHLTTATTLYREMGMTYWLEKLEAEMRALT